MKKLIFLILFVCMISSAYAFEFDNVIKTTPTDKYPIITIENAFGLGGDIAKMELIENTENCIINCYAIINITTYEEGVLPLEFDFINLKNGRNKILNYNVYTQSIDEKETQIPVYNEVCNPYILGNGSLYNNCTQVFSKYENKIITTYGYKKYQGEILPAGNYKIKIESKIDEPNFNIDWAFNYKGITSEQIRTYWATWNSSFTNGLVTYHSFDDADTSGGFSIDKLKKYNGTIDGATTGVSGKLGQAYSFDGTNDAVNLGRYTQFYENSQYTFSAWVNVDSSIKNGGMVGSIVNGTPWGVGDWFIWLGNGDTNTGDQLEAVIIDGASNDIITHPENPINTGKWIHVVLSVNSTGSAFYVNGTRVSSLTLTTGKTNAGNFSIGDDGGAWSSDRFFKGDIDEVAYWNRSLTSAEITGLYNDGTGITYIAEEPSTDSSLTVVLTAPEDNYFTTGNPTLNVTITPTNANITNYSIYVYEGSTLKYSTNVNYATTTNSTRNVIYTPTVTTDGNYTWFAYACGINVSGGAINCSYSTTNRTFIKDNLKPQINITSPSGYQFYTGGDFSLNWSVYDLYLNSCWYVYNSITTVVNCSDKNKTFTPAQGSTTLQFYANDSAGNINNTNTSWIYTFFEGNQTYNSNVIETSGQRFYFNATYDTGVYISVTAYLNYNGSRYASSYTGADGINQFYYDLDIPLIPSGEQANRSFFWEVYLYNSSGIGSLNTSLKNQTVNKIHLESCDGTYTLRAFNFTSQDERNFTRVNPFNFYGTFNFWSSDGTGSIYRNITIYNYSVAEKNICIKPNDKSFKTSAVINYEDLTNATYLPRTYYFNEQSYNNVTQNITLYLLENSYATTFILKVQDINQIAMPDTYIEIQRYNPATDSYNTVQIVKTDINGEALGFYETETVFYRHIIKSENGSILKTTNKSVIFGKTVPYTIIFTIGEVDAKAWAYLDELDGFSYSLDYNRTLKSVRYLYIDSNDDFSSARLLVTYNDPSSESVTVCNTSQEVESGLITCDLSAYDDGSFTAIAYRVNTGGTEKLIKLIKFDINDIYNTFGNEGLLLAWFIILCSAMLFLWSPVAGVWGVSFSMLFVKVIGLADFGGVWIFGSLGLSLILTIVFVGGKNL